MDNHPPQARMSRHLLYSVLVQVTAYQARLPCLIRRMVYLPRPLFRRLHQVYRHNPQTRPPLDRIPTHRPPLVGIPQAVLYRHPGMSSWLKAMQLAQAVLEVSISPTSIAFPQNIRRRVQIGSRFSALRPAKMERKGHWMCRLFIR